MTQGFFFNAENIIKDLMNECLIKQHMTSLVLQLLLTYGIVQVWVLGQVSHQSHCAPLQVDFV